MSISKATARGAIPRSSLQTRQEARAMAALRCFCLVLVTC